MRLKHIVLGVMLFLSLMIGAMAGMGVPGTHTSAVPRAYADDGCDNSLPPPGVECLDPTPTVTPTPKP